MATTGSSVPDPIPGSKPRLSWCHFESVLPCDYVSEESTYLREIKDPGKTFRAIGVDLIPDLILGHKPARPHPFLSQPPYL